MMDEPVFEIRRRDGLVFRIWEDGRTDGFDFPEDGKFGPTPYITINRVPLRMGAMVQSIAKVMVDAQLFSSFSATETVSPLTPPIEG